MEHFNEIERTQSIESVFMYQVELFVVVLSRKYKRLRIRKYFDELSNRRGSFDLVHCVDSMK